jgi:hypothetical protein
MSYDEEYLSDGDQWLKDYTYEPSDRWPSDEVVSSLKNTYPYPGGQVFRGLNFRTEKEFELFMQETNGGTNISSAMISSWSKNDETARNFCLTRPTYMLNEDLMSAEAEKSRTSDYMIGAAGILLSTDVPPNVAIDVTRSRFSKESEVILPPGEYNTRVEGIYRPYAISITESNYRDEFLAISTIRSRDSSVRKFQHILTRFGTTDDEMRSHLFHLVSTGADEPDVYVSKDERYHSLYAYKNKTMPVIQAGWSVDPFLIEHYNLLLASDQEKVKDLFQSLSAELDAKVAEVLNTFDAKTTPFTLLIDRSVSEAINAGLASPLFPEKVNTKVGEFYRHQNSEEIRATIKTRSDLSSHMRLLKHALEQMVPVSPEVRAAQRARMAQRVIEQSSKDRHPRP